MDNTKDIRHSYSIHPKSILGGICDEVDNFTKSDIEDIIHDWYGDVETALDSINTDILFETYHLPLTRLEDILDIREELEQVIRNRTYTLMNA